MAERAAVVRVGQQRPEGAHEDARLQHSDKRFGTLRRLRVAVACVCSKYSLVSFHNSGRVFCFNFLLFWAAGCLGEATDVPGY